jgi:ankyrin repeat protein/beta-lactamase regulating signal transducer with metallopeptidase domain
MIREIFLRNVSLSSCVWQSTIFIVVGLVSSFILRHRSSRAHQVLFLSMIAAVIVPIMSILVKHYELGLFVAEPVAIQSPAKDLTGGSNYGAPGIISAENIEHNRNPIERDLTSATVGSESAKFPWSSVMLYLWIVASLILAARLLITFMLGIRLLGRALPLDCQRIKEAAHLARVKLGIDKNVSIRSSRGIRSPVIWCWRRRPVLLVPSAAGRFDNEVDWAGVLCHELAHWKRRDHISGLLAELVVCILPWHPLLWWAKSRLVRLSEQACDDWVVATGQSCTDYAESLLDLTPGGQMAFVPAVVSSKKGLANRVRRILKDNCGNPRTGALWALAVSILAACLAIGVACAQTRPAKAEAAIQTQAKPTKSLQQAAADGDVKQVKLHLSLGTDVNAKDIRGSSALLNAAKNGHETIAELLIDNGAEIDAGGYYNWTPLHWAAYNGHTRVAQLLIIKGANVNAKCEDDGTPLHEAAWYGHKDVIELLLENGTDPNARDNWSGNTALHRVASSGYVNATKVFIAKGTDIHLKNMKGQTPLYQAASAGNRGVARLLIGKSMDNGHLAALLGDLPRVKRFVEKGPDVNDRDEQLNWTLLHWAACSGTKDVAEFLLAKGADVNAKGEFNDPPLLYAAATGQKDLVELLLARGAKVDAGDSFGTTPLHKASENGHRETVALFLAHGADINVKTENGFTPLHLSARRGRKEVVKFLLERGASVNAKNNNEQTALHAAARKGRVEIVELLIASGADINAEARGNGYTPLHYTALKANTAVTDILLSKGANTEAEDRSGAKPLHVAVANGRPEVVKRLLSKGANTNARDHSGDTPLHTAVKKLNKDMAELLLTYGADVNAENKEGQTPLVVAKSRGHPEITELLRKHGAEE